KPVVYQPETRDLAQSKTAGQGASGRDFIAGKYQLKGDRLTFEIVGYDKTRPLVIDPTLVYSTYLGGSDVESGAAITVDAAGHAYVVGSTNSSDFPTTPSAFQTTLHTGPDVFVTRLNGAGSAPLYSTYLGGTGFDEGFGIATDSSGNAYITGVTDAVDFP